MFGSKLIFAPASENHRIARTISSLKCGSAISEQPITWKYAGESCRSGSVNVAATAGVPAK